MTLITDLNALSPLLSSAKDAAGVALAAFASFAAAAPPPGRYVANGAPPRSPAEIAAGFADLPLFFDGFDDPSTVDLGYSYDTSKVNWMFVPTNPRTDALGAIADSITISGSFLNLTRDYFDSAFEFGGILWGCVGNPAPTKVSGISVRGSQSRTYAVKCNPAGAANFPRSWPAGWSETREMWLGATSHPEADDFEWMPRGMQAPYVATPIFSAREWVQDPATGLWSAPLEKSTISTMLPSGFDLSELNLVQSVTRCSQDFGGQGSITWHVCRPGGQWTHLSDCDVNWTHGDGSGWNEWDQQAFFPILGCGRGFPASFDFVCIRGLPSNSLILN